MYFLRVSAACVGVLSLAACASAPFGYADDRCLGVANQCQSSCVGIDNGPARAACAEQCFTRETQCYARGDADSYSPISEQHLIGDKKSEKEKEEAYADWKATRDRENAASANTPSEEKSDGS